MREPSREHGHSAADGAGIRANEVGDLAKSVTTPKREVEEVLIGRWELVEAIENLRPRVFLIAVPAPPIIRPAEIEDKLDFPFGHLTPLSEALCLVANVHATAPPFFAGHPS